ncbi:MAG: capsular polysaccharide biosynthesis protein [Pseudomonadota bacterium]
MADRLMPAGRRAVLPPADPTCGGGRYLGLQPALQTDPFIRDILAAAEWRAAGIREPSIPDTIAVWGCRTPSKPGRWLARHLGCRLLSVEDAPLRSIMPGRRRGPPAGLTLDDEGIAIDPSRPSRLERLIAALTADTNARQVALRAVRARGAVNRMIEMGLSKYSPYSRGAGAVPPRGAVLVVDQIAGDAALTLAGVGAHDAKADAPTGIGGRSSALHRMLEAARAENPTATIAVRAHPDPRRGHLGPQDLLPGEVMVDPAANPWDLLERVSAVYTVSSQLGLEAVLAGVETHVFGRPAYAGWGLTHDRLAIPRRTARPDRETLFAAIYLYHPLWWDPHDHCLTDFDTALDILDDRARVERADPAAPRAVMLGIAPWKRRSLERFTPAYVRPAVHATRAEAALAAAAGTRLGDNARPDRRPAARLWAWAARAPDDLMERAERAGLPAGLIEDGFLRSSGLGARLVPPLSLVFDTRGIHFDPARPSDLERLIAVAAGFDAEDPRLRRAADLRRAIVAARLTKYAGMGRIYPHRREATRPIILVPGQVADDASVLRGTLGCNVRSNDALLIAARAANPDATIVYKPHPDAEAGLRRGALASALTARLADTVLHDCPADAALAGVDAVWTMTSTLGFEALLRGIPVTCFGVPFYAGWGLTTDLGPVPARRRARPSLDALVWAALIAYPVYVHPLSGLSTRPERIVAHLAQGGADPKLTPMSRILSRAQDLAAGAGLVCWR